MFKGLTKDLTGSADICTSVVKFDKLQAQHYLLPGETILFAFESSKEEFSFTNEALILVKGENATTTRKLVERFEYRDHLIQEVKFETTGRVDRDCEIKFQIGTTEISIDIARKEEDQVKIYYKALVLLSRKQKENRRNSALSKNSLEISSKAVKSTTGITLQDQASKTLEWLQQDFEKFEPRCYKATIMNALAQQ
jgi:hypothetical protein